MKLIRENTLAFTEAQVATLSGRRFFSQYSANYTANETKYILFDMPLPSEDRIVILQDRDIQTTDSDTTFEILWDSTGFVGHEDDLITIFNENKRSPIEPKLKVYNLSGTSSTEPTNDGTIREEGIVGQNTGSGQGAASNRSGAVDPDLGFRVYDDSNFIIKITNGSNAQKIILTYLWYEVPAQLIETL